MRFNRNKCAEYILETRDQAEDILDKMKNIAEAYTRVTAEDFAELVGCHAEYWDRHYYWNMDLMKEAAVVRVRNGWSIKLPRSLISNDAKVTYRSYRSTPTSKPTPKLLTIAIDYAGVDDFDHVLAKAFQYAQTITDREVEISIC